MSLLSESMILAQTPTPSPKPSCDKVLSACDRALKEKDKALKLEDLALQEQSKQVGDLKAQNEQLEKENASAWKNPVIVFLLGVGATSAALLFTQHK